MALGPEGMIQLCEQRLAEAEAVIDGTIRKSTASPIRVAGKLLPITYYLIPVLVRRYQQAGWRNARFVHDPREGNYLELS